MPPFEDRLITRKVPSRPLFAPAVQSNARFGSIWQRKRLPGQQIKSTAQEVSTRYERFQIILVAAVFCILLMISVNRRGLPMVVVAGFLIRAVLAIVDSTGRRNLPWSISARAAWEAKRTTARDADYPVVLAKNIFRPDIASLRYCYFMFAPFPWACRGLADAAGSVLGLVNLFAILLVIRAGFKLKLSVIPITIFVMFALITLMCSVGVNNIGTGIRHRNKAIPALAFATVAAVELERRRKTGPAILPHVSN